MTEGSNPFKSNDFSFQAPSSESGAAVTVDVSGKRCPVPLMRAKHALKPLQAGAKVRVIATDPTTVDDFLLFHQSGGCSEFSFIERNSEGQIIYEFLLTK